jgi:predicted metal-dependent HD superfamily phosphohydrolase
MLGTPTTAFSRDALANAFVQLGAQADGVFFDGLYDDLQRAYSAPDRHYHGVRHIDECLRALRDVRPHAQRPAEVEAALWFHDAIYDTRRNDNEARSADWARRALADAGAANDVGDRVHALILATSHAATVDEPDARLTVDIDLGILGQPPPAFARYDTDIRREYHWVAWNDYVAGRSAVLRQFLARERIYATAPFYERFEAQARYNLACAVEALARRHAQPD